MTKDGGTVKCCGEEVNMNFAIRLLVSTACAALMALTGGIIYYKCVHALLLFYEVSRFFVINRLPSF